MIKFHCPNCNQKLGVPDEYVGRRIRCSKCNEAAIVPKPTAQSSPQSPTATASTPVASKRSEDGIAPAAPKTPAPKPAAPAPKPQPAPAAPPKAEPEMVDLELIADNDLPPEDPNLQAIQQASRERASKITLSRPAGKSSSSSSRRTVGATELAKGMGKIPLSLATSFACMTAVIILWVVIAKVTGLTLNFIVISVAIAGAWGLTRFTEHRGIMLGLLAVFLSLVGMTAAHAALAKWVVTPRLEKDEKYTSARDEVKTKFTEQLTALPDDQEQVRNMSIDDDIMIYIAGWDLVENGKIDKETFNEMYAYYEYNKEQPEEIETKSDAAYEQAGTHLETWDPQQRLDNLKKYYTPMQQYCQQSIQPAIETGAKAITGLVAFIFSFSLLDLIWYPMGLWGAFKLAAAIGGEE